MSTKPKAIYRTDLLAQHMNAGKQAKVRCLMAAWRKSAVLQARVQWKLFFTEGKVNKYDKSKAGHGPVGGTFGQMVCWQVVGQLDSWISNRSNDFRDLVNSSSLAPDVKHQLHFINRWHAWYQPGELTMKNGTAIAASVRKLARTIFRHLLNTHRKPNLAKACMLIDQRCIALTKTSKEGQFPLWARLSTLDKGKPINVPLSTFEHFEKRSGQWAKSLQIVERDGELVFGVMTDVTAAFEQSKAAYRPKVEALGLDMGLKTLFATDQGDLIGQGWLEKLQAYDRKIQALAKHRQKIGLKPRSERYKRLVASLRGFIRSEVGRVLNRLVETSCPAEIVSERLNFQNSNLSKRLNRILSKFGKNEVAKKLSDLEQKFGIVTTELNAAYSSQTDSSCGYVDKRNRPRQAAFGCRWCGNKVHADVNAARNLVARRSGNSTDSRRPKHEILNGSVRRFLERFNRLQGGATDPRLSNPYFKEWKTKVTLTGNPC